MCLWTPYIKTESQWYVANFPLEIELFASFGGLWSIRIASKIVQGYLCTPVESLCEVSIADVVSNQGPSPLKSTDLAY